MRALDGRINAARAVLAQGLEEFACVPGILGTSVLIARVERPVAPVRPEVRPFQQHLHPEYAWIRILPISRSRSSGCNFLSRMNTQWGRSISTPYGLRTLPSCSNDRAFPIGRWLFLERHPAHVRLAWESAADLQALSQSPLSDPPALQNESCTTNSRYLLAKNNIKPLLSTVRTARMGSMTTLSAVCFCVVWVKGCTRSIYHPQDPRAQY
jgi:hypothetical protein